MSNQVTGRVFVTVGGRRLTSMEGAKLNMGGVKRDTVLADTGVAGYRESTVAPEVECKMAHYAETNLQEIADTVDETVMFETDTGKVYTISEAWLMEPPTLEKGEVALKFAGKTCVES